MPCQGPLTARLARDCCGSAQDVMACRAMLKSMTAEPCGGKMERGVERAPSRFVPKDNSSWDGHAAFMPERCRLHLDSSTHNLSSASIWFQLHCYSIHALQMSWLQGACFIVSGDVKLTSTLYCSIKAKRAFCTTRHPTMRAHSASACATPLWLPHSYMRLHSWILDPDLTQPDDTHPHCSGIQEPQVLVASMLVPTESRWS